MLFLWKLFYFSTKWFKCESGMVTMSLKGVWRREGRKNSSHAGHSGDKSVSARGPDGVAQWAKSKIREGRHRWLIAVPIWPQLDTECTKSVSNELTTFRS